jgi:ATP-binding cassette subfamily B protein
MGFYEPKSGEILIDGINVKKLNLPDVMSCVLQDTWMFSGTIADNISYGKPDATDVEIIDACKQAQVHRIIKNLPGGYSHFYDNESNVLSDGEKQLICIARVFLKNPPIIILDEATSSVDIETEKKITIALNELSKDRTSFIIAHRPETVKNSDVAITM